MKSEEKTLLEVMALESYGQFLDESSKGTRKGLLASSTIAVVISVGNLAPTEITYFGLSAGDIEVRRLYLVLSIVVGYFLFQFSIYSYFDFVKYRVLKRNQDELGKKLMRGFSTLEGKLEGQAEKGRIADMFANKNTEAIVELAKQMDLIKQSGFAFSLKGVFDIFGPLLIGISALAISVAQYFNQDVFLIVLGAALAFTVSVLVIWAFIKRKNIRKYIEEKKKVRRRKKADKIKPLLLDPKISDEKKKELSEIWLNLMMPSKNKKK